MLVSQHYPIKDWTNFEFSIAREEEKKRKEEFILPVRLDDTKIPGLPSDKAYLDFKKEGINGVVNCLFQKVKSAKSEKIPAHIFRKAYEEWKIEGFLPGDNKTNYFLENISEIKLDVDTCEFLLRSSTGYHPDLREKLSSIDKQVLFDASRRMLDKKEDYYTK